jgi:hypothetical protein
MKSQGRLLLFVIIVADLLIVMAIVALRLINANKSGSNAVQNTATPQTSPGLVVYGSVLSANGSGLDNVSIYRSYASYQGVEIAMTDSAGYYQSDFFSIPGDEMVSIWAEKAGVQFTPASCNWRHYAGYEMKACNFTVANTESFFLPLISRSPH